MRRTVWIAALVIVAIWSLIAWASYGLVDVAGNFAAGHADLTARDPETVESISSLFGALRGLGLFAVMAVWGLVSAAILAVAFVVTRFIPGRRPARPGYPMREFDR